MARDKRHRVGPGRSVVETARRTHFGIIPRIASAKKMVGPLKTTKAGQELRKKAAALIRKQKTPLIKFR